LADVCQATLPKRRENPRYTLVVGPPPGPYRDPILENMETKEQGNEFPFDECLSVNVAARGYDDVRL
jgi:hypothetical protein